MHCHFLVASRMLCSAILLDFSSQNKFPNILRSLSVSLSFSTLEGKLEGMKGNGCCEEVRHNEDKKEN